MSTPLTPLSNAEVRKFKAAAQKMKAMLKMGRQGLSAQFVQSVDEALRHHALIKVKFDDLKDQRKTLAPALAEKTGSHLVTLVGNVVVLYRPKAEGADADVKPDRGPGAAAAAAAAGREPEADGDDDEPGS